MSRQCRLLSLCLSFPQWGKYGMGWLGGQCPCWMHSDGSESHPAVAHSTLDHPIAPRILQRLQNSLESGGKQLPASLLGFGSAGDSRAGSRAPSEHSLALLSSPIPPPRISKVFIGAVPCSPPGWVWAGQGGGTAAPGAARADLASLLTFMPISISSAACPHAGMLPGRLGSPSQGAQQSCRELGLRWPG